MTPISTSLPSSNLSTLIGTCELMHSSETWSMRLRAKRREEFLVLPPFVAERRLPFDVGGNAVAVADVHGAGCGDAVDGAVQRLDAPAGGVVHVDVEGRLVELDDVDAVGREAARLFVEQRRQTPSPS